MFMKVKKRKGRVGGVMRKKERPGLGGQEGVEIRLRSWIEERETKQLGLLIISV